MHLHIYGPNTVLVLAFPFYLKKSSENAKFPIASPFHTLVVQFAANWNCYCCVKEDRDTRQMHGVTDRFWNDVPGLYHTAPLAQGEIICHIPRGAQ